MRAIDYASAALLFVLGCIHNFVAAPMSFAVLDTRALWFVTGGMVLWYAASINLVWLRERTRTARIASVVANLLLPNPHPIRPPQDPVSLAPAKAR